MSIQRRLLVWLLAVLLVGAGVTAFVVFHEARNEANVLFDYQLRQIAETLPSKLVGPLSGQRGNLEDNADGVVVQIYNLNGERLYQSRPDALLPPHIVLGFTTANSVQGEWRVYSALFVDDVIEVAQPMRVRSELAAAVALRTAAPLVALVPLFGLLIWFTVGRGLAPLRVLATAVARRSAEDLEPLPIHRLPLEVTPLVREINLLLDRVQNALDAQRGFIADAAHELRTPVTAADLQLQLAERAGTIDEMRAALLPLRGGIARSQRLIEQLLSMARNQPEASALVREAFDVHALLQDVVGELAPLAIKKDIDIELVASGPTLYRGDRNALRVAVANLVDNAIRYTPEKGRVSVSLAKDAGTIVIDVSDSGPGISDAEKERVFDRFYRGPGQAETGSGLGLSIVERIVTRHGGSVSLARSSKHGGLSVRIALASDDTLV